MSRSVLLFSGGVDSAVCLAMLLHEEAREAPHLLFVNYGQRNAWAEEFATMRVSHHFRCGGSLVGLDLTQGLGYLHGQSFLTDGDRDTGEAEGVATVVPGRNAILLAVASSYARTVDAEQVVIGCNRTDADTYPDCRQEFLYDLGRAFKTGRQPGIHAPLLRKSKREIVALAHTLDVPLPLCWSCYREGPEPCGACGACKTREQAQAPQEAHTAVISGVCPYCHRLHGVGAPCALAPRTVKEAKPHG